jgi:transcriptional regulator with XRE-family HTH domain
MEFAAIVKRARQAARLSQRELAEQLKTTQKPEGVWATYVGQIEKGEKVPSDEVCLKLAEVLELDTQEVLLAAYQARTDSEEARILFKKMDRVLTDPVVNRLLSTEKSLDPHILEALADGDVRAALSTAEWQQMLGWAYRMRKKRDILSLLALVEAMNDKQWEGLMSILEGMGLKPPS